MCGSCNVLGITRAWYVAGETAAYREPVLTEPEVAVM